LFRDLDEARMASLTVVDNSLDYRGAAAKYAAAFANFGLTIDGDGSTQMARRLRAEEPAVHNALLVALDHWTFVATIAKTEPTALQLRDLAVTADDDSWRQRRRQAEEGGNVEWLR